MNKSKFSTLDFLEQLKHEVEKIIAFNIRQDVFSEEFLCQNKRHFEYVLAQSRKNPMFVLLKPTLDEYINQLKIKLGSNYEKLRSLFHKYETSNELKDRRIKIYKYHPNIDIEYFKEINNIEKAYWFGLLLADGSITIHKKNRNKILSVEVNIKDGIIIKNLIHAIGFDPKYVKYYKRTSYKKNGQRSIRRIFRIRFTNDEFIENMISHGFVLGSKAEKIRFPRLKEPEYQLACILGFFDGDGSHVGTPTLYSKSCDFLKDIVKILKELGYDTQPTFEVKHRIQMNKDTGAKIDMYYLGIGGEIFNDMLDFYPYSLPRKRKRYLVGEALKEKRRKHWLKYLSKFKKEKKFLFTKEELGELRKNLSYEKIALLHNEKFGIKISLHTVRYWCSNWNIIKKD